MPPQLEPSSAFGVVTASVFSRPLQLHALRVWRLQLWVPRTLFKNEKQARAAFQQGQLPLVLAGREFPWSNYDFVKNYEPRLVCSTFLEAKVVLEEQGLAAFLPDFLTPASCPNTYLQVRVPALDTLTCHYRLAWNPRLLRLNPHARRRREQLCAALAMLK